MRPFITALVLLSGSALAQGDRPTGEELRAEVERRELLGWVRDNVQVAKLVAELSSTDDEVAWRAASVLVHHDLARAEVAKLRERSDLRLRALALQSAEDSELVEVLLGGDADPALRRQALLFLEDRRGLSDEELVSALADPDPMVSRAAQIVILYERVPLSRDLIRAVEEWPAARRALLDGLSDRPRRDADAWLERLWSRGSLSRVERLHVIAALPHDQLDREMAVEVLDVAGAQDPDIVEAALRAAANLPASLADGLIAEVRWRAEQGARIADFLPYLIRISSNGDQHLLAIASGFDTESRDRICTWLVSRDSPGLRERVRAALDGEIPLELHLLTRARPQLDRPGRVRRVIDRLRLGDDEEKLKAFEVLVRAGVYVDNMLDYALDNGLEEEDRVRMLAGLPAGSLPDEAILQLLGRERSRTVAYACNAAGKQLLAPRVEDVVVELATGVHPQDVVAAATRAVIASGSRPAVEKVFGRAASTSDSIRAVQWLVQRREPWVVEILTRARSAASESVDEFLRVALARLGDQRLLDELVANAGESSSGLLRQARSFVVPAMNAERAALIAAQAEDPKLSDSVRVELVSWLGQRPDLEVAETLQRLAESTSSESLRMEALRGLLIGPRRGALRNELVEALDEPLNERHQELAFQIAASAEPPLSDEDMELMARLTLEVPLLQPEEEARGDGLGSRRAGFPMLRLVVQQLRHDPRAGQAFGDVVVELLGRFDTGLLSRRRCIQFLLLASVSPELLDEIGPPVARLLLAVPEADGIGPAHWILGQTAEAAGDLEDAAEHYRRAARIMLRDPDSREFRIFLGDADAVLGVHPGAALSARGPLTAARAALLAGDRQEALRHLTVAATLAAGDDETAQEVLRLQTELNR